MPFVPTCLTCLCALRACLPSCLKLLHAYVPTCLRAYEPKFFTRLRAYMRIYIFHAYMPLCLKLFRTYVCSFPTCLCAYNHSQHIYWGSPLYLVLLGFFWIIWLFIPFKTPKQTLRSRTAYPNPLLCGFVISTAAYIETII